MALYKYRILLLLSVIIIVHKHQEQSGISSGIDSVFKFVSWTLQLSIVNWSSIEPQPSPAQPSPAQPSPAQPSPAQPSPAQPSPAQPTCNPRQGLIKGGKEEGGQFVTGNLHPQLQCEQECWFTTANLHHLHRGLAPGCRPVLHITTKHSGTRPWPV